jgi:hypothetical protein
MNAHPSQVGQDVGTAKALQKLLEYKLELLKPLLEPLTDDKRNRLFSNQGYIEKIVCLTKKYSVTEASDYTSEFSQSHLLKSLENFSEVFQKCDFITRKCIAWQVAETVKEVTSHHKNKDKATRGHNMLDMFHTTNPYLVKKTSQEVYTFVPNTISTEELILQPQAIPSSDPSSLNIPPSM